MALSDKARKRLFAKGGSNLVRHGEIQNLMNESREFPMKFHKSLKKKMKEKKMKKK